MGSRPLILDTHVLLWLVEGSERIGSARGVIDEALAGGGLAVSAISWWEIAMLVHKSRLELNQPARVIRERLLAAGLAELAVDGEVAIAAPSLEGLDQDPADRLIVATTLAAGGRLATADRRILDWDGPVDRVEVGS